MNYATMKKELQAIVFALDKFRAYLMETQFVVYMDHLAIKYLRIKIDVKSKLILWLLILQELDQEIWDKKETKNLVWDHL